MTHQQSRKTRIPNIYIRRYNSPNENFEYGNIRSDVEFMTVYRRIDCRNFCNHLDEEERAACFALIVFLMSCDCYCSMALPHGPVGWSAVCNCGIS